MGKFLIEDVNAKGLFIWMNDNFRKQNGKRFTRNDVQAYIMRGHLPEYLGGNEIVVTPKSIVQLRCIMYWKTIITR